MTIFICLDDADGLAFNHRRQSRDRIMLEHLVRLARSLTAGGTGRLLMAPYTAGLFPDGLPDGAVAAVDFLDRAEAGDVCFVEDAPLAPHRARITCLYVFRWNRDYPADRRLDLDLSGWERTEQEEFPGSSHDKITLERYLPPAT